MSWLVIDNVNPMQTFSRYYQQGPFVDHRTAIKVHQTVILDDCITVVSVVIFFNAGDALQINALVMCNIKYLNQRQCS